MSMTASEILQAENLYKKETSLKYMLTLAAPMIVTNISFTLMQFVDRYMVSRLGTDALAAVLPAGVVSFIPAGFAIGVMTSVNTFVSQSLGKGDKKGCSNYCWQAIYMGLIYFVFTTSIMWPAAPHIFKAMGYSEGIVAMEVTYLRIMLLAQMSAVFIWSCSNFFMGVHKPIITMYAALCAQTINVAANYVLIFGKFGFPELGFKGAAWGTLIGVSVGAAIRLAAFLSNKINSEFQSRNSMKINFSKMRDMLKVGFPAGLGLMINVAAWGMIVLWLVAGFGKAAQAATSAAFSCINLSVMPVVGISVALTAAVGKSIGQNRKDIAVKQTSVCLRVAMVYMGLMGLCFFLFRNQLMAFWSSDDKVVAAGVNILVCVAIFQIFDAAVIIYNGSLRGAGDTVWLAMISAFCSIAILGFGGLVMVKFFPQLGPIGPWIAATGNVIIAGLANRWRFKSKRWMNIDLFKRRPVRLPVEIETIID